jgi:predicted phosphodiesterase
MHPNHTAEMDLFQEEQIFFAVDSLKILLSEVHNNTSCPIEFYSIHGNHDRVGIGRDQDKSRTAGKVISHVLKRELENDRMKFFIPKNNLCKIVKENICIFVQHGDSSLSKKKPSELVNLYGEPGCFTILVQGHWHSLKVEEGTNFIALKVPSVASSDKFILEELGNNNLPGFITGKQPEIGYGFDYNKITLY